MEKVYDHKRHEGEIYRVWEKSGAFTPTLPSTRSGRRKPPFTIIMPPPNANDPLHLGHARFVAIEDILTRYHRMKGEVTLWLPGADHAGIETQYVFEKKLAKEGKSRFDFSREELYRMIWDNVQNYKHIMEDQLRKLGASCDWSRNRFTLDKKIVAVVNQTFKKLYDEGLVYRGERIVNYCPRCGTNFSELEVDHVERSDSMYYLDYGPLAIATVRPETIFADVAVAVNPKDKRYQNLIGKTAVIPLIERKIPIISDDLVDPKTGTGALKVTPGHDPVDFEIGQKHALALMSVIDPDGKMVNTPSKYVGLDVAKARLAVVEELEKSGKLKRTKTINHTVSVCYRDKGLIEPMISKQWFIKMKPLVKPALGAIREGEVKFASKKYEKIALHWLNNLKDWNISRQIVWGIRIPAWRCSRCLSWTITKGEKPGRCQDCGHTTLNQDTDTFDTWFSSGQWPYATLKTTKSGDFGYFYPTSIMNTAYEILPFWVLRMVMLGLYETGDVPFKKVLIHGLVRDREGRKISKSKGNVIDPIEMVEKYGSDALRMGIIWGSLVETDIALSEDNIKAQRNFANKLWNVARYIRSEGEVKTRAKRPPVKTDDDKKVIEALKATRKKVTTALEKYRLNEAAEAIFSFVWKRLANDYLEKSKPRRKEAQPVLEYCLQESLKLAHPFMPFLTETIWQQTFGNKDNPLIQTLWPKS